MYFIFLNNTINFKKYKVTIQRLNIYYYLHFSYIYGMGGRRANPPRCWPTGLAG